MIDYYHFNQYYQLFNVVSMNFNDLKWFETAPPADLDNIINLPSTQKHQATDGEHDTANMFVLQKVYPGCDHSVELLLQRCNRTTRLNIQLDCCRGAGVHYPASKSRQREERGRILCQSLVRSSSVVTNECPIKRMLLLSMWPESECVRLFGPAGVFKGNGIYFFLIKHPLRYFSIRPSFGTVQHEALINW